jgi:hypothetical protein
MHNLANNISSAVFGDDKNNHVSKRVRPKQLDVPIEQDNETMTKYAKC